MTRTVKKIFLSIFLFILIIIIGVVIPNLYNSNSIVDLKDKCYKYLTENIDENNFKNYSLIVKIMYPKPTYGIKYVNKNIDYEILEKEKKEEIIDKGTLFEEVKYYNKVKIKVTSYNYALAYKNAVTSTNKYIKENENANNDEIEKYFANRLEYEGGKIIDNNEKTVMYVFKKEEIVYGDGHNRGLNKTVIRKLPEQKDNLDFLNAMLGGLVEEMDRTKLPEGVDLEETMKLMGIE